MSGWRRRVEVEVRCVGEQITTPGLATPAGPSKFPLNFYSCVTLCVLDSGEHWKRKQAFLFFVRSASNLQQSLTARAYARLTHFVTHEGLPQIVGCECNSVEKRLTQDSGHIFPSTASNDMWYLGWIFFIHRHEKISALQQIFSVTLSRLLLWFTT